jgi:hypothetical protein
MFCRLGKQFTIWNTIIICRPLFSPPPPALLPTLVLLPLNGLEYSNPTVCTIDIKCWDNCLLVHHTIHLYICNKQGQLFWRNCLTILLFLKKLGSYPSPPWMVCSIVFYPAGDSELQNWFTVSKYWCLNQFNMFSSI